MSRKRSAGRPRVPPRPAPEEAGTDARERLVRTAYELFTREGLTAVGVDRIVDEAAVAKTTLYRHFRSKDELIAVVLERHHRLWLEDWLGPEARARGASPAERLLAVFDALDDWFGDESFQGCLFINTVLETHDRRSAARHVSIDAIGDVHSLLQDLAAEAGARSPAQLAHQVHLLVRGAIVAATEGRPEAVREAREAARVVVEHGLSGSPRRLGAATR